VVRYLSVCSGIEAATQAWHPRGWTPVAFSEIEPFPSAVLAYHYPAVPNWGDMTKFKDWPDEPIDLLVGGTPCQSFSIAGLRAGLADPRGNLALTYLAIVAKYWPRWVAWENVPGVYSALSHDAPDPRPPEIDLDSDDGPRDGEEVVVEDWYDADEDHAFACFVAGLQELGYGVAYRTLDAQYVRTRRFPRAVPQRRRRVFVVGYLGDWRRAAAVLFDRESLSGHPPPRREAEQGAAPPLQLALAAVAGLEPTSTATAD
jgi:DNA (cytosine-5)-methyltransferase 1